MTNICVFAGSSEGRSAAYAQAAQQLGEVIAGQGYGLVYGGAEVGLMGAAADGALSKGGRVIGILPEWLADWEVAHGRLTELRIVDSMHERKAQMADLADAFVVLPGGIGSLEECFEIWTWSQLGIHQKSIGLLNVNGYYDQLMGFLDHVVSERFLKAEHRDMLLVGEDPAELVDALIAQQVPNLGKWVER
jgi:uncharacterized protein (TIGR00730 family)